jgi:hypothetical protein
LASRVGGNLGSRRRVWTLADSKRISVAKKLPLAEFVQSNGSRIKVILVEGHFFGESIEPSETWGTIGNDVLLASSVDERRSTTGSLSAAITAGCAPKEPDVPQPLGWSSISKCGGKYSTLFNIHQIARLTAIVEASDSGQSPCWQVYGIIVQENDYQNCVSKAVASGLAQLFEQISEQPSIDAVVLPAIGTGVGKLSKPAFYNTLMVGTLVPRLKEDYRLPPIIYLQVRREREDPWLDTEAGIAIAVATAVRMWEFSDHTRSSDSEWLSLTGVAISGSLMLVALAFGARFGVVTNFLPVVARPRPLLIITWLFLIITWLSVAVGLVSVFKAFIGLFPTLVNPYLQVAAGAVTAILCGPLSKADDKVHDILKRESDTAKDV